MKSGVPKKPLSKQEKERGIARLEEMEAHLLFLADEGANPQDVAMITRRMLVTLKENLLSDEVTRRYIDLSEIELMAIEKGQLLAVTRERMRIIVQNALISRRGY